MKTGLLLALLFLYRPFVVSGQHHMHHMKPGEKMPDSAHMEVPSAFSRNLPMQFNGSGTTWHTENAPMYMHTFPGGAGHFMLHYGVFFRYSAQNISGHAGQRGERAFDVPNWLMLMWTRPLGKSGQLMLRGMFSADRLTTGGSGYPLLFQTGESWEGKPLTDRQHPHDLFSELSIGYAHALSPKTDVYAYFGLPGEPSIGPPAFMHRPSALNMPAAPLGHHWQDATHITFGVTTLGIRYRNVKLEGSAFNGREPDENRYDIDRPRFDSYSGRVSVNPFHSLALQASYAHLKSPEALHPEENIERITASALHTKQFANSILSSTFVWGLNRHIDDEQTAIPQHALLLESDLQCQHFGFFTRLEWVQKSDEELNLEASPELNTTNRIGSWMLGFSHSIWKGPYCWMDAGLTGTAYDIPARLNESYGSRPFSFEIFLRIIPPRMGMKSKMQHMGH